MSPYAKFGLDRPSRSAGHRQPTDRHVAFYYVDTHRRRKRDSTVELRRVGGVFCALGSNHSRVVRTNYTSPKRNI